MYPISSILMYAIRLHWDRIDDIGYNRNGYDIVWDRIRYTRGVVDHYVLKVFICS